ncbi:MAG: lytic transglycosylase domain-containing protein [Streptosporangiaceae bacterium]
MRFPSRLSPKAVVTAAASLSLAGTAAFVVPAAFSATTPGGHGGASHVAAPASPRATGSQAPGLAAAPRQLYVPDMIAAVPGGITPAQLTKIAKLSGVRAVLPVDGGKLTVNGRSANVLGVSPQAFRPWTPLSTAGSAAVWSDLSQGKLVSTAAAARRLHLSAGKSYQVSAATDEEVPFGGPTALSIPGVDAVVNLTRSAQLGLARNFAVLINAPEANLATLKTQVQSVVGKRGQVVNLVSYSLATAGNLPVATDVPAGAPADYLDLFKRSAAEYCPGMSWTVLAAIAEIESGDGANDGPSSAGALGPMQFLPSTWAEWGIDGFGPSGMPQITNPLDAVPSAARLLCAAGAGSSATLPTAIFAYNHATWYVSEVLALASEYGRS